MRRQSAPSSLLALRSSLVLSLFAAACAHAPKSPAAPPPTTSQTACSADKSPPVLFLVDGKPVTCAAAMTVKPDDIESVEVLKGPAAESLYGAPVHTGVIVIRTKKQ